MHDLTPRQIVTELDRHIVGQNDAKRAVAIAIRNRWRRQQLDDELRKEVAPKNILMIGPTGVGKTEIARRLATLTGAPFIKVEATKYTEVGYYGRDVESMVRELVENAIGLVRTQELRTCRAGSQDGASRSGCSICWPRAAAFDVRRRYARVRPSATSGRAKRCGRCSLAGEMETAQGRDHDRAEGPRDDDPRHGPGSDSMDFDFQGMFEKILPKNVARREMTVAEARRVLFEQECEAMINQEKVNAQAIELAENVGHHLPRRDGQDRGQRRRRTGPTFRGRACSAICCRSSKARSSTRATATCGPTTCCSSRPGRFTR